MFRFSGRALRAAALAVAVICAYAAGVVTGGTPERAAAPAGRSLLDEAAAKIGNEAAEPVSRGELEHAAIDGMLKRLGDKWARYYSAREFDDFRGRLNGRYSGVGVWLGVVDDGGGGPADGDTGGSGATSEGGGAGKRVRVASVQPGSAAERAGVRVGDVISRVGDRAVTGWDVTRVATALRGTPSSDVVLTVDRAGREHRFTLVRTAVSSGDVTVSALDQHMQIIRVGAFTRGVGRQVRGALSDSPDRHRGGVLLDLRGNPGGLLTEAVETASAFLADGLVVTYERQGRPAERMNVTQPGDKATPLVVLVDAGTASAAEVVAGSLRDRDRAVIVGSRTFGKGSVQEPVRLADGSAIELTVGRYRTPSGRNLDGVGIDPDVAVSADRPPREAEQRAQAVLRGLLATLPNKDRG
ncbi:S41 family peptidase [Spirillospora sp. NPDC047279]|uniref:S41 family peptidase n=1 Tax=Spirillospora sp. NPDC047279 TaxID=3155478 RepID=UPI0033D02341